MLNLKLGEIDLSKKPVKAQLFLCKPNKDVIAKMNEAYNVAFNQKLGALNELNFNLPVYIDIHHQLERNKNADTIKGRYIIKLVLGSYEEYFLINTIDKVGQQDEHLEIKSYSLSYELNDKIIRDYKPVSKTATELLNGVLVDTIWTVGYVDSKFDLMYRGLDVSSSTVQEAIVNIAKTFDALIVWDTINRKVNLYQTENVGEDKGFGVKYGKYLDSLNEEENAEQIITRLKLYGKDGMSIRSVNPTGTDYIEDFTYFIFPYKENRNYSTDIFTSSQIASSWSSNGSSSDWIDNGGVLQLALNTSDYSIIYNQNKLNAKNYKIHTTFKAVSDDDVFGFIGRYQDQNNYYYVGYESGKIKGGQNWSPNHLRLYKVVDGITTLVSKTDSIDGWSINVEYQMKLEFDNDLIKVWIDDVLVLYARDNELQTGAYGFFGYSQMFRAYDISVDNKDYTIVDHSDYMSDELCHYLLEYDRLLQDNKTTFNDLVDQKSSEQDILTAKGNELTDLQTDLKVLLDDRDVLNTRIAQKEDEIDHAENTNQDVTTLKTDLANLKTQLNDKLLNITSKQSEIDAKEQEINVVTGKMDDIDNKIEALNTLLSVENTFTKEQLSERNQNIVEEEWSNDNIIEAKDLLQAGIEAFNALKEQRITLKIDIVNFLSMVSEQRNWDKLNLGDTFTIEYDRLNVKYKAKITEIDYDFEQNSINITITNVKDLYENKDKVLDMLYQSYSSSTAVNMNSWKWSLALGNQGAINEIINNKWNANKNAIVGAKDQVVELSDRGLIIRDPNDPMNYLVGINSLIAITNDGGSTWKHAITSTGIVGERIYGKVIMGVKLAIEDENGIVKWQGSKGEIYDSDGNLVMRLGLIEDASGDTQEDFGLMAFNDMTRVEISDLDGFVIDKKTTDLNNYPDGWKKVLWADQNDGTLYADGLVTSNIKIVDDLQNEILNAEKGTFNLGWFEKILHDNKLTTTEKLQLSNELYKIYTQLRNLVDQSTKYMVVSRDDKVDVNSAFDPNTQSFSTTKSTKSRFSTDGIRTSYLALIDYMKGYVKVTSPSPYDPLQIDLNDPMMEETTVIQPDRATFMLKFKNFYDEAEKLRNEIENAIDYNNISMGSYYNNILMGDYGFLAVRNDGKYRAFLNATNGLVLQKWENKYGTYQWVSKVYASIGDSKYEDGTLIAEDLVAKKLQIVTSNDKMLLDADNLTIDFSALNSILLDNKIVSTEKVSLLNQFDNITEQYTTLKSQISRYESTIYNDRVSYYPDLVNAKNDLESTKTSLISSYNALYNFIQPIFKDMSKSTDIVIDLKTTRNGFNNYFKNFYQAYSNSRNALENFLEKSSVQLGKEYNNVVIDAINGITVDGLNGEEVRLNAKDGFYISINGDKRIWISDDGTIRARKLIIEPDGGESTVVLDKETDAYISDLLVNSLKSIPSGSDPNAVKNYVYIRGNFLKLMTGTTSSTDAQKLTMSLEDNGYGVSIPTMKWGTGDSNGRDRGYIVKDSKKFRFEYVDSNGNMRKLEFNDGASNSILLDAIGGNINIASNELIRIGVGSNYIELSLKGIKLVANRIDLN